jgi:sugar-specific transcriptional regulator TrmB
MAVPDLSLLDDAGFSLYERRALAALLALGVADAAALCVKGDIPTSKIYLAMEKLERLGLCEVQPSRPKLFSALAPELVVERLVDLARERAETFAKAAENLRETLAELAGGPSSRQPVVDLALGQESHVKRHLTRLADARSSVLSYMEAGDIAAINAQAGRGFDVLKRLSRARERRVDHRAVFGFSDRTAPTLLDFLRRHASSIEGLSGIRYSGELGHPFHVIDREMVILSLDNPFVPEGRFASLLVRDSALAASLSDGFDVLWQRALADLREIRFYPRRS